MNQQAQYKDSGTQFYLDTLHQILPLRQRKKVKSFRPRRKCHMAAHVPEEFKHQNESTFELEPMCILNSKTVVISPLLNLSPDG
jgi:hypothetical protein